jgi:sulfate transport system ATP-binding protein
VFDFIGDSSQLPVVVDDGHVRFDNRIIAVDANGHPNGPATLFFRPNHIRLSREGEEGRSIVGRVTGSRRLGDARRLELEIGEHRCEIDVPADADFPRKASVAIQPTSWRLYPVQKVA